MAAVELLNVIRPVVAIAVYLTFVAHALHRYPHCRHGLRSGDAEYREWFVQEVRRFYPFFPAVVARVRQDFEWRGYAFPAGRRVMLDLYGTDHDVRLWQAPETFRPERFVPASTVPAISFPRAEASMRAAIAVRASGS